MVGRNDQCPCGSGKKYKKCCEGKEQISIVSVMNEEIENVLQNFYSTYPERKDTREYLEIVQAWKPKLEAQLQEELVEAISLDEFFFHKRPDIWTGYLKRTMKKIMRPATLELLEQWSSPVFFVGRVDKVEELYFHATCALTNKTYLIRRENNKPIPEGMNVFAFLLPDGTAVDHVLAVSTLIFFPAEHNHAFDKFGANFKASGQEATEYVKENHLAFWSGLVAAGYAGEEFTSFEQDVLGQVKDFLAAKNLDGEKLMIVLEDYLVEQQPTARKAGAIAGGAIRFGQDRELFDGKFTVKEIAESFGISASSLNKYHQELLAFQAVAV